MIVHASARIILLYFLLSPLSIATMGFIDEFRQFAVKGNVVDMAVGIMLGVAFNKVVTSLVNDVLMPPIGMAIGNVEVKHLAWTLQPQRVDEAGETLPAVVIRYGQFVNTVVEFLIIALTLFVVVRTMNRLIRLREQTPA